jgi:hypothetical protein
VPSHEGRRGPSYRLTPPFLAWSTAAERHGIQPVVAAIADGGVAAGVTVARPVTFAVMPRRHPAGTLVAVEWDGDGTGTYPSTMNGVDGAAIPFTH